jgi:hypothetical protein
MTLGLDPRIQVLTVGELGYTLPVGVPGANGSLERGFSLKDLETPIERAIGKWRQVNHHRPTTALVTKVVGLLLNDLGGKEYNHAPEDGEQEAAEKLQKVSTCFLPDVYYMYTMARINELGNDYKIPWACEKCGFIGTLTMDLSTMKVYTCGDPTYLKKEIELVKGLKFRDGSIRKKVTISPMLWMYMEGDDALECGNDPLLLKLLFLSKCIVGVEGFKGSLVLTKDEINSFRKIDIEKVSVEISNMNLGPAMSLDGNCPNDVCKISFSCTVDWDYDNFFSITSPS